MKNNTVKLLDQSNIFPWLSHIPTYKEEYQLAKQKIQSYEGKLTGATLFSGMGGSAWGMMKAGIKDVFFNDFEQHAIDSLKVAFPDVDEKQMTFGDICDLKTEVFFETTGLKPGELFMLQASPPCQDFSNLNTANPNKAFTDRNMLFMQALRFVKDLQPKVFILENVPGFYSNQRVYWAAMYQLSSLGYNIRSWKLNSRDYGSRQSRPRFWVVAYRKDLNVIPSKPKEFTGTTPTLKQLIPDVLYLYSHQFNGKLLNPNRPIPTITKSPNYFFVREITDFSPAKSEHDDSVARRLLTKDQFDTYERMSSYKDPDLRTNPVRMEEYIEAYSKGVPDTDDSERNERFLETELEMYPSEFAQMDELGAQAINKALITPGITFDYPTVQELLVLSDFPPDWPTAGTSYFNIWNRIGNIVLPTQMQAIAEQCIEDLKAYI